MDQSALSGESKRYYEPSCCCSNSNSNNNLSFLLSVLVLVYNKAGRPASHGSYNHHVGSGDGCREHQSQKVNEILFLLMPSKLVESITLWVWIRGYVRYGRRVVLTLSTCFVSGQSKGAPTPALSNALTTTSLQLLQILKEKEKE